MSEEEKKKEEKPIKKEQPQIILDNYEKQYGRYYMANMLGLDIPISMKYIQNIVTLLKNNDKLEQRMKEIMGEEEYEDALYSLERWLKIYSYIEQIRAIVVDRDNDRKLTRMEDDGSGAGTQKATPRKKFDELLNKKLLKLCVLLPALEPDIMRLFYLMVKNTDLRNQTIPVSDINTIKQKRKIPFNFDERERFYPRRGE